MRMRALCLAHQSLRWRDKSFRYGMLIALIVGIFFRFFQLGKQSLWSDELVTAAIVTFVGAGSDRPVQIKKRLQLEPEDSFLTWKLAHQHPPFFDLLLKGWVAIFGSSDTALRLPSAIFGCLLPLSSWFLLRQLLPLESVFYYVVALSLSFSLVQYSQEARPYALGCLLAGLLTTALTKHVLQSCASAERGEVRRPSLGTLAVMLLLCYTHYYGAAFVVALSLLFALDSLRAKNSRDTVRLGIPLLLFAPWVYFAHRGIEFQYNWVRAPQSLYSTFLLLISNTARLLFPHMQILGTSFLLLLLVWWLYRTVTRGKPGAPSARHELSRLAFSNLALVLIFLALVSPVVRKTGFITPRHLIFIVPSALLAMSVLLTSVPARAGYKAVPLILLAASSLGMSLRSYYRPYKEQYREASSFIAAHYREGDRIITTWRPNRVMYLHYLRQLLGASISTHVLSLSLPSEAKKLCEDLTTPSARRRIFIFYHNDHRKLAQAFTASCKGMLSDRVVKRHFIGVNVELLATRHRSKPATVRGP